MGGGSPYGHVAEVIWFTIWQAAVSTVLTLAAGLLPAYVLARYSFRGRRAADGGRHGAVRAADGGRRRGIPGAAPGNVARLGTGDDRGPRVLQHRRRRASRRFDDRRDPTRSGRRRPNPGSLPAPGRTPDRAPHPAAGAVVGGGDHLPLQLHLVRCRHAVGRPHPPDARGRDRPTGDTARRRSRCCRTLGVAARLAGRRDRVDVAQAATLSRRVARRCRATPAAHPR